MLFFFFSQLCCLNGKTLWAEAIRVPYLVDRFAAFAVLCVLTHILHILHRGQCMVYFVFPPLTTSTMLFLKMGNENLHDNQSPRLSPTKRGPQETVEVKLKEYVTIGTLEQLFFRLSRILSC